MPALTATLPIVNECLDLQDSRRDIPSFKIGDLVTESLYSDSHAGRVIDIRRNGREVVMQEDTAIIDPTFKPEFVSGGFAGHCVNQRDQKYTYQPNPDGAVSVFTLRAWRRIKVWTRKGNDPNGHNQLKHGQHKFYDYNF